MSIKEYLNVHKNSLSKDYNASVTNLSLPEFDKQNEIISQIHKNFITGIMPNIFQNSPIFDIHVIGSGTQGYVLRFKCQNMKESVDKFEELVKLSRINKGANFTSMPNEVAIKIQTFITMNKHFEERVLREEYLLDKIQGFTSNDLKQYIPNFYYGATIGLSANVRFRLTFMELIDNTKYATLEKLISEKINLSDQSYATIKRIASLLWKAKITHNDLSLRNILVNRSNPDDIKIVDFGLAQMLSPDVNIDTEELYKQHFQGKSGDEQHGSNVAKLLELFRYVK